MAVFLAGARRFIHRKPRWMSLFSFTTTKHLPVLIGGFTFTAISSLSVPIFSVLLGEIFNTFTLFGGGKVAKQDLTPQISKYAVQLVGLGAINWVCNSVYFILFVIFGEFQVANARTKLFERLLQKSQEWFETQPDGTRVFLSSLQGYFALLYATILADAIFQANRRPTESNIAASRPRFAVQFSSHFLSSPSILHLLEPYSGHFGGNPLPLSRSLLPIHQDELVYGGTEDRAGSSIADSRQCYFINRQRQVF